MRRLVLLLLLLLAWSDRGLAQPKVWTIDDIVQAENARDWQISPDGRWAVWVKRVPNQTKNERVSNLMLSSLTEKKEVELTRGNDNCTQPRWSPDGRHVAFLSTRPIPKDKEEGAKEEKSDEPETQLWMMSPFGGEAWALTTGPREVKTFRWAGADTILFAAQEKASHRETVLKDKKDTSEAVEDEAAEPPVRLFSLAVPDKKVVRFTSNTDRIQSVFVSPDGRHAVTIHERSLHYTYDQKIKPVVHLHDLKTRQQTQIFADKRFHIQNIHWSPDSKGFYALNAFTRDPRFLMAYIVEPHFFDLGERAPVRVNLNWDKGLGESIDNADVFAATSDGFVALLADGARNKAVHFRRDGKEWRSSVLAGDHQGQLFGLTASVDGKTLIYLHSTASKRSQWFRATGGLASPVQLTKLGPDLADKTPARTEIVRWKGARNEDVEGILYYPHKYENGRRYPLVVMIHGGPAGVDLDAWDEDWAYPANLVCARGALVLKPNYHGSTNYGLDWVESLAAGKYYELPVADIEKGIDSLIARGLADPDKLALSGWSNGAILTSALITRSPRYKAAIAGAGGAEWVADWGSCEFGMAFSNYYLGTSPLDDPQLYRKNAPFYDFTKVRTPTLIFQGSEDRTVPPHHGWLQYRGLQQLGKTDVRFILFPGEKHSLKKLSHQRRKVQEELAWLDKYLFRTMKAENSAFKKSSPLERLVALQKFARQGDRLGLMKNGILVPETVVLDKLHLGRFEVTRAQFAEFDKTYAVGPGKENFPANGISFQQAKDYCSWLSKATGQKYRLGQVSEMKSIYEEPDGKENNLDYWADYAVNPEDTARLLTALKELPGTASLLKEVGSFPSSRDKTPIFDLGGNIAEWAVEDSGQGQVLGGSAVTPADNHAMTRSVSPEYVGFRVLKEE